jgi:hypothetical protein
MPGAYIGVLYLCDFVPTMGDPVQIAHMHRLKISLPRLAAAWPAAVHAQQNYTAPYRYGPGCWQARKTTAALLKPDRTREKCS